MIQISSNALPLLRAWAHRRNQPVTIFDLEATTFVPHVKWFGITEIGMLTILPTGKFETTSAFVDPERNIPPKVRELTGITNEDVKGQPTWGAWVDILQARAREHVMVGYNSSGFDCPAVMNQNARYGTEGTVFEFSLDAMALPDVSGKLGEAAAAHGITSDTYHRAMADVWITAQLVEAIAQKHGLDVLDATIGKGANLSGGNSSPRIEREAELLKFYKKHQKLPELGQFGEKHGIKKSTAEGDVQRLIEAGDMPSSILENPALQSWLEPRIAAAISECWGEEPEGRLKPLFVYFEAGAPDGFDYTQLKLAIRAWRLRTTT